jgi:hypothetical protein
MNHKDDQKDAAIVEFELRSIGSEKERSVTLRFGGAVSGTLVGLAPDGAPLIDFPGNPTLAHLPARSCVRLDAKDVGREIVLLFDSGDPKQPVVMGLVQQLTGQASVATRAEIAPTTAPQEVELDGKNIELTAKETITLRCGDASITLNRDGKIVIRGMHVVSHAAGVNRIRGGSVQLN